MVFVLVIGAACLVVCLQLAAWQVAQLLLLPLLQLLLLTVVCRLLLTTVCRWLLIGVCMWLLIMMFWLLLIMVCRLLLNMICRLLSPSDGLLPIADAAPRVPPCTLPWPETLLRPHTCLPHTCLTPPPPGLQPSRRRRCRMQHRVSAPTRLPSLPPPIPTQPSAGGARRKGAAGFTAQASGGGLRPAAGRGAASELEGTAAVCAAAA